jgi:hypothetical protein
MQRRYSVILQKINISNIQISSYEARICLKTSIFIIFNCNVKCWEKLILSIGLSKYTLNYNITYEELKTKCVLKN